MHGDPVTSPGVPKSSREKAYWAWTRELKRECEPVLKLPDSPSHVEHDKKKASERYHKMKEKEKEYDRWLQQMQETKDLEMNQRIAQGSEFVKSHRAVVVQKAKQLEQVLDDQQRQEGEYWEQMQNTVVKAKLVIHERPRENVAEKRKFRVTAFVEDDRKRREAYDSWVKRIQKPTGLIPKTDASCLNPKERTDLVLSLAKKKRAQQREKQVVYEKWKKDVNEANEERLWESIEEQKRCKEELDSGVSQFVAERTAARMKEQRAAAIEHQQFVHILNATKALAKAQQTHSLIDHSHLPGSFAKQAPHRQNQRLQRAHSAPTFRRIFRMPHAD
eukprot:TRINITY_DN29561_c0_g1_i1.p1 TRINITY_DN29561_c0_g1~~TRINITY_DN29561_c0_g1_i1.p1  ORF type:complete len:332 (+),score=71.32 TRINITY_DN29561_c0_g1_i1:46-1041(+)